MNSMLVCLPWGHHDMLEGSVEGKCGNCGKAIAYDPKLVIEIVSTHGGEVLFSCEVCVGPITLEQAAAAMAASVEMFRKAYRE